MSEPKPPGAPVDLSSKDDVAVHKVGRDFISRLAVLLKVASIYQLDNDAIRRPTSGFVDAVNIILETQGRANLSNVGDTFYLNTNPIKLDAVSFEASQSLVKMLRRMAVNEIEISSVLDYEGVIAFLEAFQASWRSTEPEKFKEARIPGFTIRAVRAAEGTGVEGVSANAKVLKKYAEAVIQIEQSAADVMSGRASSMARVRRSVQSLSDAIDGREEVLGAIVSLYRDTGVVAHHLASTMAIAMLIGKKLGISKRAVSDLCLVAVLHDVGRVDLPTPDEATADPARWSKGLARVADRTALALCRGAISVDSLNRVATSHEHLTPIMSADGPLAPGEMSRIIAVACAYDTLTSGEPPGLALPPDEAMWAILNNAGKRFDPIACRALATTLGLYPVGSMLELESGRKVLVIRQNKDDRMWQRPWVRDPSTGRVVDLGTKEVKVGRILPRVDGSVLVEHFLGDDARPAG